MTTKTSIPKNIATLIAREAELQASVDKWSVDAFRAERDRLEGIVHSGTATDADIIAHAATRDGGETDRKFRSMATSSLAALDAHRRSNWYAFREFLKSRLESRRKREAEILHDVEALSQKHGISLNYSDPEESTTAQLAMLCEREDAGFVCFQRAAGDF